MGALSEETVARDGKCLVRLFRPISAFQQIQNIVRLHIIKMLCCQVKIRSCNVLLTKFVFIKTVNRKKII
jgi:hypothetical protein